MRTTGPPSPPTFPAHSSTRRPGVKPPEERGRQEIIDTAKGYGKSGRRLSAIVGPDGAIAKLAKSTARVTAAVLRLGTQHEREQLEGEAASGKASAKAQERRQAKLAKRARKLKAERERQRVQAKGAELHRASLSLLRRSFPRSTDLHLSIIGVVASADIALIGLAQQILPGKDAQHWFSAVAIGAVLAGFGHVVGELGAGLMERTRHQALPLRLLLVGGSVVVAGAGLIAIGLHSMTGFRNLGLVAQVEGEPIPTPSYLGWVQAIAVYTAAVSASIWRIGETGREYLTTVRAALDRVVAIDYALDGIRMDIEACRDGAEAGRQRAAGAMARRDALDKREPLIAAYQEALGDYLAALGGSVAEITRYRARTGSAALQRQLTLLVSALTGVVVLATAEMGFGLGFERAVIGGFVAAITVYAVRERSTAATDEPQDVDPPELPFDPAPELRFRRSEEPGTNNHPYAKEPQ